jgi:hypothetical protein
MIVDIQQMWLSIWNPVMANKHALRYSTTDRKEYMMYHAW